MIAMLRALVEHYVARPGDLPPGTLESHGDPVLGAVAYVGGMTDRFACAQAVSLLGWPADRLPKGQYQ